MAEETERVSARLVRFEVSKLDDGAPGYRVENPFGQTVVVLPRPPAFRATAVFEWDGAMPDEIAELDRRAGPET